MLQYLWTKMILKLRGRAVLNSQIHLTSKIESGSQIVDSRFDKYSFCGYNCQIINAEIGSFCSIANNVVIGGAMHPLSWVSMSPVFYSGKDSVRKKFAIHDRDKGLRTKIGSDVWIGEKAIIKQGVTIGDGAVVGMGSVVTNNIEPYCIVGGSPARIIRKRFDDGIIIELLETKWWNLDEKIILSLAEYITDPNRFLKELKKI